GLERAASLAKMDKLDGNDWYTEGWQHLLTKQRFDGSWLGFSSTVPGTSFAVLFMAKATAKMMRHRPPAVAVGTGLLAGGRGLPDDLTTAETKDGKVTAKKLELPIDKLLADISNTEVGNIEAAQTSLVSQIQVGKREELIGQKDLLVKLADDTRDEVRRTAMWALGRCDDLRLAPLMIKALKDNNIDVNVEARNALCSLSRRPLGFGMPATPVAEVSPTATPIERETKIREWQREAYKRWMAWYNRIRPYEERDELPDLDAIEVKRTGRR
ncbi:MAG: hypothetical protein CMJ78_15230, partial [Planctomycetaceae bacterium]|nr:hypothetical protein [Planctomycetaceae bacterium]